MTTKKTSKKFTKTCTECGVQGTPEDFVVGKRTCLQCNRNRVARSQGRMATQPELDLKPIKRPRRSKLKQAFDSRDALSDMLKLELQQAIDDANDLVSFAKARLEEARKNKDANQIDKAVKGLENAQSNHIALITRLTEKLQAMEDLRQQSEKAKPVTFYFNAFPDQPQIKPVFDIPPELYPDTDTGDE